MLLHACINCNISTSTLLRICVFIAGLWGVRLHYQETLGATVTTVGIIILKQKEVILSTMQSNKQYMS